MTTYNFIADPAHANTYWSNPAVWQGGVVPSGASAAVVIPTIYTSSNSIYASHIDTLTTAVSIKQLFMANNVLEVGGAGGTPSLAVAGTLQLVGGAQVTVNDAGTLKVGGLLDVTTGAAVDLTNTIDANGSTSLGAAPATMTVGNVESAGTIDALGSITASGSFANEAGSLLETVANADASSLTISAKSFDNAGQILAQGGSLAISAQSFDNTGSIWAQNGSITVTTGAGGLENLLGGTLSGGTYQVGNVNPASPSSNTAGDLYLQGGSALATLSAQLTMGIGSDVFSYNGSAYAPLEATLQTITSSGTLSLVGGPVANWGDWGPFTDNGLMQLNGGSLTTPQLTIGLNGTLDANGQIIGALVDNGTLVVGLPEATNTPTAQALDITGAVTGSGTVTFVSEGYYTPYERTLEFGAASSASVKFGDVYGTLVLDDPAQFTGVITPFAAGIQQEGTGAPTGDQIDLPGVALSDMTGYSYSGNASGGVLTLDFGSANSTISLNFAGDLTTQSFSFANHQPLSTSPPTLVITAVPVGLELITSNVYLPGPASYGGPVEVASGGSLNVSPNLSTAQLTIDHGGNYYAGGETDGPVVDNGAITLTAYYEQNYPPDEIAPYTTILSAIFDSPMTGSGTLTFTEPEGYSAYVEVIDPGGDFGEFTTLYAAPSIELKAAASINVVFVDDWGTLVLDDPAQFTGSITPSDIVPTNGAGASTNVIELTDVPANTVVSYSYSGNSQGGTLTLHLNTGGSLTLKFVGDLDSGSFTLNNVGPQSSSYLVITVGSEPAVTHDNFLNAGLSDILLTNTSGQVDVGQMSGGSMALTDIFSDLGSQWRFAAAGDFVGNGHDQFIIENTQGSLGLGSVVSGAMHLTPIGTIDPSSKVVADGDYLGDGYSEFLVEKPSGEVDLGEVSGGNDAGENLAIAQLGSQWKFVGSGDFLGPGHDLAAIENTLGDIGVGTVVKTLGVTSVTFSIDFTSVGAIDPAWKVVETGDFLGHGKSDFLIDNTATGAVDVGEVVNGSLTLTQIDTLGSQWKFVGAGDYLGDGKDQILIENTAGSLGLGEVSGSSIHFTTVATGFSEWMFH